MKALTPLNDYLAAKAADPTFQLIADDCLDYPLPLRFRRHRVAGYLIGATIGLDRRGFQVLYGQAECPDLDEVLAFQVRSEAYEGEAVDWDHLNVTNLLKYANQPDHRAARRQGG